LRDHAHIKEFEEIETIAKASPKSMRPKKSARNS
jgi:hypothetical protein